MGQSQSNPSHGGGGGRRSSSDTEPGSRYRALARKESDTRRDLSRKSQDAWTSGDRAKAKEYSLASQKHHTAMEAYNALAASEIFAAKNPRYDAVKPSFFSFLFAPRPDPSALTRIDLHGLYVLEAMPKVKAHLEMCRREGVKRTFIITGRGLHSVDGVAKIRPQVEKMLAEERVRVVKETGKVVNEGAFLVEFMGEGEEGEGWGEWFLKGLFGR